MFHLSEYFTATADDADILILLIIGAVKDMHLLAFGFELEGTWEFAMYEAPSRLAAGTIILPHCTARFHDTAADVSATHTPAIVNTTVDALSAAGQKVLNVTATANFVAGNTVCIDDGEGGNNEYAEIDTIQAGVSLTMVANLANAYTNETVHSFGERLLHLHSEGGVKNNIFSSDASTDIEWILKSGEEYLIRATNRSGALARASMKAFWAEKAKQT